MPELPEVETTCRGISPHIIGKKITHTVIRQRQLRWPVPSSLTELISGQTVLNVSRRAKYLLLELNHGTLIIHLGMSGSLRIVTTDHSVGKHDHLDFIFSDNTVLRYNDPRKFGAILWSPDAINTHPLIKPLGPEPLSTDFDGPYLYQRASSRKTPVKAFIMDSRVVVGVGNIYASESLYQAGIHPSRQAGRIALKRYQELAVAIKAVLCTAIDHGGTTLRDFVNEQGNPGYFQQSLAVYGRSHQPCPQCSGPIKNIRICQRSSYYCSRCQT